MHSCYPDILGLTPRILWTYVSNGKKHQGDAQDVTEGEITTVTAMRKTKKKNTLGLMIFFR